MGHYRFLHRLINAHTLLFSSLFQRDYFYNDCILQWNHTRSMLLVHCQISANTPNFTLDLLCCLKTLCSSSDSVS